MEFIQDTNTVVIFNKKHKFEVVVNKLSKMSGRQISDFFQTRSLQFPKKIHYLALLKAFNERLKKLNSLSLPKDMFEKLQHYENFTEFQLVYYFSKVIEPEYFALYRKTLWELIIRNFATLNLSDGEMQYLLNLKKLPIEEFNIYSNHLVNCGIDIKNEFDGRPKANLFDAFRYVYTTEDIGILAKRYGLNISSRLNKTELVEVIKGMMKRKNKKISQSVLNEIDQMTLQQLDAFAITHKLHVSSNMKKDELVYYFIYLINSSDIHTLDFKRIVGEKDIKPLVFTVDLDAIHPFGKGEPVKVIHYEGEELDEVIEETEEVVEATKIIEKNVNEGLEVKEEPKEIKQEPKEEINEDKSDDFRYSTIISLEDAIDNIFPLEENPFAKTEDNKEESQVMENMEKNLTEEVVEEIEEPTEDPVVQKEIEEPTEEPVVQKEIEEPTEELVVEEEIEEPTEEPVVEEEIEEPIEELVVEEEIEEPTEKLDVQEIEDIEDVADFEDLEKIDGLVEEVEQPAEIEDIEDVADFEDLEKIDGLVEEVEQPAEIEDIEDVVDFEDLEKIDGLVEEVEQPAEIEDIEDVVDTEDLMKLDGVEEMPADDLFEESTEEIVEEVTEEPIEENVEEIIEESTEENVEEIIEESTEEIVEEVTEESTEEIVEEVTEEPTEESDVELAIEEAVDELNEIPEVEEEVEEVTEELDVKKASEDDIPTEGVMNPYFRSKKFEKKLGRRIFKAIVVTLILGLLVAACVAIGLSV